MTGGLRKQPEVVKGQIDSILGETQWFEASDEVSVTSGYLDLLCLLLDGTEQLVTIKGGAELAVMVVEDLLHLQDALAAEVVQAPLLVALLGA